MRFFHAPPVGAVINRRGPGGRMGRRPAASGFSAPAGGLVQRDALPISLLVLPKEKRAVHGPKRKNALVATLHMRAKLLYGGRREIVPAGLRGLSDGRGGVRYRLDSGFPRRGCGGWPGCKDASDQLLFPRVPLARKGYAASVSGKAANGCAVATRSLSGRRSCCIALC